MRRLLAAVAIIACGAMPAAAFMAQNGLLVKGAGGTDFVVPYTRKSGPAAFWCAAGDYAVRELQVPKGTRVFRVSEPPRGSGEGIRFSLDPAKGASRTGLVRIGERDAGVSAVHARFLCNLRQNRD